MSAPVRFERIDGVGVITLDNPPVNALSIALRTGVRDALSEALADDAIAAVVLTGGGRMFCAGADIKEFDTGVSNESPNLPELIELVESSPKPVVAAMHGTAMGGGCELALGCHARVAAAGMRIGLPEVTLGLVPGAGGTQRLPRVLGVQAALDVIVSGRPISAENAHAGGLVDELVGPGGDLVATAVAMAKKLAAADGPPPKTRDREERLEEARQQPGLFNDYRKSIARRARGFEAPYACIDCVEVAVTKPFEEGLAFERDTFQKLRASDQSKAQRHAFFAERQANKVRGVSPDTKELPIRKGAVLGCGTMGGGIAMCFANAGIPVTVTEGEQAALDRGMKLIQGNYAATVKKGRMSQEAMDACMALITPTLDFDSIADSDIVIEAVFENMDLKKEIFTKLDALCRPDAVLATNTSSLDVNEIAATTSRPEQVVGLHFFSPANVMKLLEIVRGDRTSPQVLATALALSKKLGKVGVVVGVCDSFAANRSLYAYSRQAGFLLEEGALPEQVDKVITDFGFPMGPFAVGDLAGVDVGYKIRQHRGRPDGRYSDIADKLYEMGRYGQKTAKGWFRYEDGRTPIPDPEVTELIIQTSKDLGIERREISDEEILQRCLYPLINEGARILEEGIVERSSDMDLIWLYGYGFPRYRGGPMFWADLLGVDHVYEVMKGFHEAHHDWLEPAPLLERLAKEGGTFGGWSAT
ncbi:MAG: 3-hydroxyacyl-CoA dehydrogenase NAD-binding domain-containing protein [Gemmatimonadota bacterium]|nr:3-hydroxyacyl-CoA dehydrogenase NAD-binding domain-containing protein [Gemmatimonadota bacterium]MDH3421603.1 3-hydroxyacyl-CoA dehydrogenase NAD-binding domain-containing protein [Gemmatimonadota bacterium]